MSRVSRFCPRCKVVHSGPCPKREAFGRKRYGPEKKSGRGGRRWYEKIRPRIFKRDNYLCQICLRNGLLTPVELSGPNCGICDHIVPLAEGGTDDDDNLQIICKQCDKEKTHQESMRGRGVSKSSGA